MAVPRLEVWSDWECNSGVMEDVLRDVEFAEEREEIQGEKGKILYRDLTLIIPRDDAGYPALRERKVIRIVDTPVREFRIFKLIESHSGPKRGTLECLGPEYDLKYSKIVRRVEANGLAQPHFEIYGRPPTEHIDVILGLFSPFVSGAPSYFSRGTVEFTDEMDMIYDWDTPLSALEELLEIYDAELLVRRNGATDFKLDMLLQIGSTGDQPLFTIGRNILSIDHESDSEEQANVVFVQGGGAEGERGNIAANGFIATGVSGDDITFDEAVVHEDDQWNTFYVREPDGTISAISDSAAPSTITVPGHSVAIGDIVTFVENAAGDDLIYVESPSSIATYGETAKVLNRQDIPNINNLSWNGFFNYWTQGGFGPEPCFPSFVDVLGGASDCITRTFVGLAHTAEFNEDDSELLTPRGWAHRVSSTGAINDAVQLANINGNLGINLAGNSFGSYEIIGQQARNVNNSGPAIDGVYFGNDLVVQVDLAPGWAAGGCQEAGIYGKWRGPDNFYQAWVSFTGGSIKIRLYKRVNGVLTQIGTTYDTTDTDCTTVYTLKLAIEDGSQQLYVDGTLRVSGTDTTFDGQDGYGGIFTESSVDGTTGLGAAFDDFNMARGKNEIVMTGLPVNWTIEACGLSPATADANGTAVLDLAGADLDCTAITVKDDVAAVQDTFTPDNIGIYAGDVFVWSCDDANPGISPDLNRTNLGHLVNENFDAFQCPSLADSCWFRYPRGFPAFYPDMDISCIAPFSGYVEFTDIAAGDIVGRGNQCWGRESILVQSTISARTNIQAEPGVAAVLTNYAPSGDDGYIAYVDDASGGTLHLAKITDRALASLGTDTTWTFTTDTDYVIQLHVSNGVQEARLWQAGSIVATVSATNSDHQSSSTNKFLPVWTHRAGTAIADTSRHAQIHADTERYITVTNMPSGSTAQLRDDTDTVIASAAESSGIAKIDVLGASEPQGINWNGAVAETHLNNWRAVTVISGGNEIARFQGVIHPGDTFDVGG